MQCSELHIACCGDGVSITLDKKIKFLLFAFKLELCKQVYDTYFHNWTTLNFLVLLNATETFERMTFHLDLQGMNQLLQQTSFLWCIQVKVVVVHLQHYIKKKGDSHPCSGCFSAEEEAHRLSSPRTHTSTSSSVERCKEENSSHAAIPSCLCTAILLSVERWRLLKSGTSNEHLKMHIDLQQEGGCVKRRVVKEKAWWKNGRNSWGWRWTITGGERKTKEGLSELGPAPFVLVRSNNVHLKLLWRPLRWHEGSRVENK